MNTGVRIDHIYICLELRRFFLLQKYKIHVKVVFDLQLSKKEGIAFLELEGPLGLNVQQKQIKWLNNNTTQDKKFYTELSQFGIFLYSAFIDKESDAENNIGHVVSKKKVIILAWQNKRFIAQNIWCCVLSIDKTITQNVTKINRRGGADFLVMRIECLIDELYIDITGVSLTTEHKQCSQNNQHYITPAVLEIYEQNDSVAMCNDLLYGTVNPKLLVEWFEIHRFLGVDKFTIHQDRSLNSIARHVLQYYKKEGILEVFDFESPDKDTVTKRQQAEHLSTIQRRKESQQMWTDESLAIFDCRERHKYYALAIDIDLDEFVVTRIVERNAIKNNLTSLFRKNRIGVYSLYANLHFTSGKPTNAAHPLMIGRYQDATQPVDDRVKNIYMPSRVEAGKGMIHKLVPKYGFLREYIDPSIATFHHFRECKAKTPFSVSMYSNGTTGRVKIRCDSTMKDNSIKQLLNQEIIIQNTLHVFSILEI